MAIDERRRSQRYERLAGAVGEEAAGTMFELLPPPQTDLATIADLDRLERKMEHRFELADQRFEQVDQRSATSTIASPRSSVSSRPGSTGPGTSCWPRSAASS
jgi:hypothetical protein